MILRDSKGFLGILRDFKERMFLWSNFVWALLSDVTEREQGNVPKYPFISPNIPSYL